MTETLTKKNCKSCGRELPADYKSKKCEYCSNRRIENIKKGAKAVLGVATLAVVAVFAGSKEKEK